MAPARFQKRDDTRDRHRSKRRWRCFSVAYVSIDAYNLTEAENERVVKRYDDAVPVYYDGPYTPSYYTTYDASSIVGDGEKAFYRRLPVMENLLFKDWAYQQRRAGDMPESRLFALGSLINAGLFNNRFPSNNRPALANLANRLPVTRNPEFPDLLTTFDGCTAPNGESGICAPSGVCSVFGGRPSGNCFLGKVCCINAVTRCGATATLNNTYWQSPATSISSSTSCTLNVRLDTLLKEQKQPICQLRLDFISFTISQPNSDSVCNVDTFQVGGSLNQVPVICGDNNEQHMYIHVPNSGNAPSDVQLMFTFTAGTGAVPRSWNIKIAMLPCGASYLAPADCLQYFTTSSGTVRSFNWRDVALTATRQLANQDYSICFRNEIISGQRSNTFCVTECTVSNAGAAFRLTGGAATSQALPTATSHPCFNDYVTIVGGFNPAATGAGNALDRFCGGALNVADAATSSTVCSTADPFRIYYRTNGNEITTAPTDAAGNNNVGFCFTFSMRNP